MEVSTLDSPHRVGDVSGHALGIRAVCPVRIASYLLSFRADAVRVAWFLLPVSNSVAEQVVVFFSGIRTGRHNICFKPGA